MAKLVIETSNAFIKVGTSITNEKSITTICNEGDFELKVIEGSFLIDGKIVFSCYMNLSDCSSFDEIIFGTSTPIIKHNISSITFDVETEEINPKKLSFRRIKDYNLIDVSAIQYDGKIYTDFTKNED